MINKIKKISKFLISTFFVYDLGKFKCLCNLYQDYFAERRKVIEWNRTSILKYHFRTNCCFWDWVSDVPNYTMGLFWGQTTTQKQTTDFINKQIIESLRFWDEDDYKYEIFSILSSARAWASLSFPCAENVRFKLRISQNRKWADRNSSKQFLWIKNFVKLLI